MPKAPDWIDKVNYIVDFWVDPCHAPLLLYIRLARDPLKKALITWFSFGLDDILRGYLRPSKALGSGAINRRGKERRRNTRFARASGIARDGWRATPGLGDDVGNWIGKNLPGASEFHGRHIGAGEHLLWLIDGVSQKALFFLMLADVTIDFLYEWATLVAATEFCQRDRADSLYATGPASNAGFPFGCSPLSLAVVQWQEGAVAWSGSIGGCGSGTHTFLSATTVTNAGATPVLYEQRSSLTDARGTQNLVSATITIGPGQQAGSVMTFDIVGQGAWDLIHCVSGGGVIGNTHDVTIWGGPLLN